LEQLRYEAEQEKQRADSLLTQVKLALDRAELMQRKVETAMFDKAVKEQFSEWLGYDRYDWSNENNNITKKGLEILKKADSLDLSNNALLRIPQEVTKCPNLKHINLLGNSDIDWASSENTLSKLNENVGIYVSVNNLSDIDSTYWHYVTGIEILKNGLNEIPENILQQKQLVYLDLGADWGKQNYFSTLPNELFTLTNLQYLNLSYCNITSLPPEIGNLSNLTILQLSWNDYLTSLPPEIGKLSNLTELNLYKNNLTSLPPEIEKLTNLTYLNLTDNRFTSLPPEIGKLSNLTELNLYKNYLTSLPPEIDKLTNLTYLNLEDNNLTSLPPEIGNLSNLTKLYLRWNNLTSLPPKIGNLKNLTALDIQRNPIISLPAELKDFLQNFEGFYADMPLENYFNPDLITELEWYEMNLTSLPPEIGKLSNLTYLDLSGNNLTSLPPEIGKLANLTKLDLSISTKTDNKNIFNILQNLPNLHHLYLDTKDLTSLPPEIGKLANLTELNLDENNLTSLPPEIGKLANLTKLDLRRNNFSNEEKRKIKKLLPNCRILWVWW